MTENQPTYTITFTKEEYEKITQQLVARLDALEEQICTAGKNKQVDSVVQMSALVTTIRSFCNKMTEAYCDATKQSYRKKTGYSNSQSQFESKRW